ncbi:MAG: chemotaxis protein CheA [Firmicutes bacterium]|nr:chemotaxis protein CheA [Bacillota bacterium]
MLELEDKDALLETYVFETSQLIDRIEDSIVAGEKTDFYAPELIDEVFRIMHTIKGSSAMMQLNNIATLAHSIEDLFFFLRENNPPGVDYSVISDHILGGVDFIKVELAKMKNSDSSDGDASFLIQDINATLTGLQPGDGVPGADASPAGLYQAVVFFEDGCGMENIRAYTVMNSLLDISEEVYCLPEGVLESDESIEVIRKSGFKLFFKTREGYPKIQELFEQTALLSGFEVSQLDSDDEFGRSYAVREAASEEAAPAAEARAGEVKDSPARDSCNYSHPSIISVNVGKLDKLMDLVGELVIAEAMVTQNPDLKGLNLDHFHKAARQLGKITGELQDMVMSIRMVPLAATFHKMHRVVRDMRKKLDKDVVLEIIGEETEVDKNIIEQISDPLMHLIRNSVDHGIETREERLARGKDEPAKIVLEAKNASGDVLVLVRDNGRGMCKAKILERARRNGLLSKPESEMTDREIYNLVFLPGFSTQDSVTEYSGRGVGMDVVLANIQTVGGSVSIDSTEGAGTTITLKIPLTLAIIGGMNIKVGRSRYTIPTISIKESFRAREADIFTDPDGNELIMVRGQCYSIVRLHDRYKVKTDVTDMLQGIIVMVENGTDTFCIFADELLGEQQVVVKALPDYIKKIKRIDGIAGCTLLGDGSVSLILDVAGLLPASG